MKYKFLLKVILFFKIGNYILTYIVFFSGQSVITDIVRDEKGNISSIEYYSTVSKNLNCLN